MTVKKRLDCLLVERGMAESREKAKAAVMMGDVYVDGQKLDKAGTMLRPDVKIEMRGEKLRYVSRGGLKLEKALRCFPIRLEGKTAVDVGASTGGFTDCMLQNGAKRVYAVDVGYGQLAWKLRIDPRVVCLERTNVRYLRREQIPEPVDFFTADVAFISLKLVLPVIRGFLRTGAAGVCLIKPQFEAGRKNVGKNGVVRDPEIHLAVVREITGFCLKNGFSVEGLSYSPVKGPKGNIEYLAFLRKSDHPAYRAEKPEIVVKQSHEDLDGGGKA